MSVLRTLLLAGSQNQWLRERAPRYRFVRRTVERFIPGETLEAALEAGRMLQEQGLGTVFTYLGENITDAQEAEAVAAHYVEVLTRIRAWERPAEISVKLTQLGLDVDPELCYANVRRLLEAAAPHQTVWIDMESSPYVDVTLDIYRRARAAYSNVGVCLQAYLYRTERDLLSLLPLRPSIRLVKGAYREPPDLAFPRKRDVDANFFALAQRLLSEEAQRNGVRAAIATHDRTLIRRIAEFAAASGIPRERTEFQMLYGIQRGEQRRLAQEGYRMLVLISYGSSWFPWFMRRLAERPANLLFLLRHLVLG
ncbi:MAG: proline dehydrogenase family protein [Blastocatellia bacterium]|nr:proline dehydrogenase family protein [Blastocatellia bacterium]MCS7157492.1 proline dehydrogenase family protein [Blastocatellia bacterium]MCX7752665.1 proline dehydrogenase family protein [Blastocatellia bacterium]MDW8168396.1 proline dehydrogenase family protein [Acidobacteriota bacterium]MDW8255592.1 proline dehydrogenase family protein [Acidobacteriota bacterium]